MAERVLTLRELNRATLARQLLLERRKLGLLAAIERLAGLQAQSAPAPYVGLWTRLAGFRRETLERALLAGDVLRPTVMRGTLHLVTARDYPTFYAALRDMPTWYDATHLASALPALAGARALAPLTHREGLDFLEREHGHADDLERRRIFHAVRRHAHLLHAPETGLWRARTRVTLHAHPEPEPVEAVRAQEALVRRYLGAFGPATRADVAEWSGLRVRDLGPALDALEPLRRFRDERGRELLDLPRAPLPSTDTPAPVRFLPRFDNLILSHADRRRVIADEHRRAAIQGGMVEATFLVDGFAAGLWWTENGRVLVEPFAPLPRGVRREVEDEAAQLEAWLR